MSWLPNPFKSLGVISDDEESLSDAGGGSVKEDLSEIGVTIGRQLRGVAEFLAPPPRPSSSPAVGDVAEEFPGDTRSPRLAGIKNDLAEISGSFKSLLSSKIASNFTRRKEEGRKVGEEEDGHGVGITDEVVDFVAEISEGPECWTDFPLSVNDDGPFAAFSMTQAQVEHICTIEKIVPSLADLKTKLKSDMSEKQFWMIYFILLIPRLDENSLKLLSTPEVIEARNRLLTMLRNKRNSPTPDSKKDHIDYSSQMDVKLDRKGHGENSSSAERIVLSENSVVSRGLQTSIKETAEKVSEEDDTDAASADYSHRQLPNEDNISFSDLEGDDTDHSIRQYGPGRGQDVGSYSSDGSSDWVRLKKNEKSGGRSRKGQLSSRNKDSEGEEPSDWLKVHESDYFN